jgi:hypothetical protein
METNNDSNQNAVIAKYTPQRIPQFQGNPLIEALPPVLDDASIGSALKLTPSFDPEQRNWSVTERIMMLASLANFMVPFQRHIDLARSLDSMIRSGYVGRAPRTSEHTKIFQKIYEKQIAGETFRQTSDTLSSQISTSLVGLSGMGKTTTVLRWISRIPEVIYHPELKIYQIPYLHIEMPSDGSSMKGLAHGILRKIDSLIPGANYHYDYAVRGKAGADTLMRGVARVMHMHYVGLLIPDEVQNLANSRKNADVVMTELVSACNDLKLPMLFIGTNKAKKVLARDFRQARRSSGFGVGHWDRFPEFVEEGQTNEWDIFIQLLWTFQWVRKPATFNSDFAEAMYYHSQGIIDIAIKLFAGAQARAMANGSEEITTDLIAAVYSEQLKLLHPMVEALRNNDMDALSKYDDISPISLDDLLDESAIPVRAGIGPSTSFLPGDKTVFGRLVEILVKAGHLEDDSRVVAQKVEAKGTATDMDQAVKQALAFFKAPRLRQAKGSKAEKAEEIDFSDRPDDYRRAIQEARKSSTTVLAKLKELGMARSLESTLSLS